MAHNHMSSNSKSDRLMWQHPFVNIFKQFKVDDWKKSSKEGDVSAVVDKHIKATVYKIQGSVPAGNYIQFPRTTTQSLGLTGRFLYILFKPIPTKYFVVHLDTVADDGLVVRISFSNLFKEFKSTATWLQFPFACHAARGSVEHYASLGARQDFMGPAPLAQKWTMLVLDLHYILSIYMNRKYSFLKNIRLCANILVKNCFTSDICYDPRLSVRLARIVGIKSVDENFAPMPREMNFFIAKDKEWDDMYDVVRFPLDSPDTAQRHLPYDSIQRIDDSQQKLYLTQKNKIKHKSSMLKSSVGVIKSPRRDQTKEVDVSRNQGVFSSTNKMTLSTRAPEKALKTKRKVVPELPPVGLSVVETRNASCSEPDATVVETSTGDIHVFAGECSPDRDIVVHRHFPGKTTGNFSVATTNMRTHETTFSTKGNLSNRSLRQKSEFSHKRAKSLENATYLEPDPILKLQRVIGFGRGFCTAIPSLAYQSIALWHPSGNDLIVYAVHAIVVAMEASTNRQHFFIGHTDAVTALAFNIPHGNSPCILASCQRGSGGIVRIWRFETQKCAAIIRCQHSYGMKALALSATGGVLVGIGKDGHGKTLFMVWDTSSALKSGNVTVIAKANTDVEINRVHVCPTDDSRMVTCGRDNVRFWRVRSNQLRSCPAVLPSEPKIEEVTDIKFAPTGLISVKNRPPESESNDGVSIFACTKGGYLVEIDYYKVTVRNVHKLYPPASSSKHPEKGIRLNSLNFSGSYLATGSDDGILRLWPLDLSAVFLEVEHEGPIKDIAISKDGVKVLATTSVGTLGFLDVSTRKYSTLMRSHTDVIKDGSIDGLRRTLSTCSDDRTIRVWDIDSMRQLYDFATPDDPPIVVCCHPLLELFACGFMSGAVRIFHVSSTSILSEHTPTNVKITCILFALAGQRLIAGDRKGCLTLYDTSDVEHVGSPLLRSLMNMTAPGDNWGPRSVVASPDDRRVAFIGPNEFTVTVAASATLDELLCIDVSTGFKMEPDILNQRPKIDAPVQITFSSCKLNQLLILTRACRLIKLDAKTGQLLSITDDIHRHKPTSICACDDDKHLVTAGDKIIKVWDYEMSKDINFQAFIGHSAPIHSIFVTPDRLKVITMGEDAIFMWKFLSSNGTPPESPKKSNQMVVIGRKEERDSPKKSLRKEISARTDDCPQPDQPPTPHRVGKDHSSGWVPPETLHTSDLDASHVSEFTVDARMMERLTQSTKKKSSDQEKATTSVEDETVVERLKSLSLTDPSNIVKTTEDNDSVPVKVAWNPKLNLSSIAAPTETYSPLPPPAQKPAALCHYSSVVSSSQPPTRTYAAPKGEEGMFLHAVIGYNGNGRGNLLWNPDIGLLAYTSGAIVTLEKLAENQKFYLQGHTEEISCLAMQHDGQIIASVSASNGLVQSKICLWDTHTHLCRATLKHHDYDVVDLAYSRDDRFMVSLGDYRECSVVIWNAFDGMSTPIVVASAKTFAPMHRVVWNPHTSNEFVTVGAEGTVCFWLLDEQPQKLMLHLHDTDIPDDVRKDKINGRILDFTSACFADDHILYIGASNGLVSAWDTTTNTCFLHWKADSAEITFMKTRGDRLLVAGASRNIRLWSLVGTKEARCYSNTINFVMEDELSLNAPIMSGAFDDTLDMGIVGTTPGTLWYIDWTNRSTVRMVSGHSGKITDVAFDEANHFATSCDQGTIRLWDGCSLQLTVQFQVIDYACCCITFSHPPQSAQKSSLTQPKMLAAGYQDGTLRVFDLDKLILKLKLQPHSTGVASVQFAADNNTLLSGARDGTVAATSLTTGVTLRLLRDHKGAQINNISCSLRMDHPASLTVRDDATDDHENPGLTLICGGDRRVSVWDTDWRHDVCNMIDWLTFPAPCFAPDGSKLPKDHKKSLKSLPPSFCYFHPTNPDLVVYCGYGMDKSVHQYSLTQRKVVKSTTIPNWASTIDVSPQGHLFAMGTDTRLIELVDTRHGTFQDFIGHSSELKKLIFSPDGKLLLSAAGSELFVWRMNER